MRFYYIFISMKKKQLINEVMGVPKVIDVWVDYFSDIVESAVLEMYSSDKYREHTAYFKDEEIYYLSSDITIPGNKVMDIIYLATGLNKEELINSEQFKDFPLFNPSISVDLLLYPDEVYDETYGKSERTEASFNPTGKIKSVDGVEVYDGCSFSFSYALPFRAKDEGIKDVGKHVKPSVSHELTHCYQMYMTLLTGKSGFGKEGSLNMYKNLHNRRDPIWDDFIFKVYLHLSFEVNARITELYYSLMNKDINSQKEVLDYLKKSPSWDDYVQLKSFSADKILSDYKSKGLFGEMMLDVNIEEWSDTIGYFNKKTADMNMDALDEVPKSARKDPKKFFKFFEKRIHSRADKMRKKLSKVVSKVVEDKGL